MGNRPMQEKNGQKEQGVSEWEVGKRKLEEKIADRDREIKDLQGIRLKFEHERMRAEGDKRQCEGEKKQCEGDKKQCEVEKKQFWIKMQKNEEDLIGCRKQINREKQAVDDITIVWNQYWISMSGRSK